MSEVLRPLILDLVAFVAERPRPYAEVQEAWRTSCPRLTVWEDWPAKDVPPAIAVVAVNRIWFSALPWLSEIPRVLPPGCVVEAAQLYCSRDEDCDLVARMEQRLQLQLRNW